MNQSYTRDSLGRLSGAGASLAGGGPLRSVGYELDILNRRDVATWNDGTLIDYGYNDRNEVTSAKKKFDGGAFVGGSQYEFEFDDIGNRVEERFGGDASGGNLRVTAYSSANALNQLTSRTPAGSIFITGEAETNLTLQGFADQSPFSITRQQGESFFGEVELDNAAWSQYPRIKVVGKDGATVEDVVTGSRFLAQTPETFQFDADGNRTSDARWNCSWDAENRLIQMETRPEAVSAGAPKQRFTFSYDANHRRYKRQAYVWNTTNGTYQLSDTTYFVYDGWNLLAELDQSFAPVKTYQWGLDLSGTQQGAGGVGGLLSMKDAPTGKVYYYTYDGNGNVQELLDSNTSEVVAEYEYSPFGQVTKAVGPFAKANRFRFSTKLQENESGWLYYGFRHLDVNNGVWVSRDPIGETGGVNLHGFVVNNSISNTDPEGLKIYVMGDKLYHQYDRRYAGRVKNGTLVFAQQVMAGLQRGVSGKDPRTGASVQCLELYLEQRGSGPVVSRWEIKYRIGADYNGELCKNCINVKRLKALIDNPKAVNIYNTDFGGANSSELNIPIQGNSTNVHYDPYVNMRLPTLNKDGKPGLPLPTPPDVILWHEVVGHGGRTVIGVNSSHPYATWNEQGSSDPRTDPVIDIENEFRQWIGFPLRYPKYWDPGTIPSSANSSCCPE